MRHHEVPPESIPTGEQLLDRETLPFLVWVPGGDAIVLGNSQEPEKELNVEAVQRDGIPVFKRISGGGAVLLSPGCVCVGLRFAKSKTLNIHDYFAKGSDLIGEVAAERLGLDLRLRGTSDLAYVGSINVEAGENGPGEGAKGGLPRSASERKVAGCALYMPRDFVLYLVSILVDPDFTAIEKYLSHPSKEPDYRDGRTHRDFLAGLGPLTGKPLRPEELASWILEKIREKVQQKIPAEPGLDLDWDLCADKTVRG